MIYDTPLKNRKVPFTDNQWALICQYAQENNMRAGQFIRNLTLNKLKRIKYLTLKKE